VQKVEYGKIFTEITNGYSQVTIDGKDYFFKHPSQAENFEIYDRYNSIYAFARSRGIQTEEEKVATAIKGGWWTKQKEDEIENLRELNKSLRQTREKLLYPSQKADIDKQITRNERILVFNNKQRSDAVGYTVEHYAGERFQDETIIQVTYKNKELTERLFSDDNEYYYLSEDIVEKIKKGYNAHSNLITQRSIKCVAACGFFQNLIFVAETKPSDVWGRAATQCTKYQLDLLIYGKIFKNLIKYRAESGTPLSEEVINSPEKLVDVSEHESGGSATRQETASVSSSDGQSETKVSSFVGATKEDLKAMGVKVAKIGGKSLLDLAKENGGKLDKGQYLDARLKM